MTPIGKIVFSLIGLKLFGALGLFWGMFLGHVLIDRSILNQIIKKKVSYFNDSLRLMIPYRFYFILDAVEKAFSNNVFRSIRHRFDIFWDRNLIKILGAVIGFSLQSKTLIFTGIIIGFFIDSYALERGFKNKTFSKFWRKINPLKLALTSKEARQVAFIQAMASLSAKICTTDGKVTENEISTFQTLFSISENQNAYIANIFYSAQKSNESIERYAYQIKLITNNNLELKESAIDNLFKIAVADGNLSSQKLNFLREISDIIELPIGNFEIIKDSYEDNSNSSFYKTLGINFNASDEEIKRKWKELLSIHHPDKIQASGGDEKAIRAASYRVAKINNAYQQIMKKRSQR